MSGKLIILFKDKTIDAKNFSHLADVVIFNQYSVAPDSEAGSYRKYLVFEANGDEIKNLAWFVQFSGVDVMYVLDRSLEVRERLKMSRGMLGRCLKLFNIALVQLGDSIFSIKDESFNMKLIMKFACKNGDKVFNDAMQKYHGYVAEVVRQAQEMRETFIRQKGMVCERCDYDQIAALDLYPKTDNKLKPIQMIVWGKLREYADVQAQVQFYGQILCHNCVALYNESIEGEDAAPGE